MKSAVSLVLSFFLCMLGYAQHISEFTSLASEAQDSNFNLPSTHSFQILFTTQQFLDLGGLIPEINSGPNFDFTGYVPREGSSKLGYLSINSEIAPGAVTILDIEFDDSLGRWIVDGSELVDFSFLEFPTAANCSGTVTPWNTIISCEEYTSIELDGNSKYPWVTTTDLNGDGYDDFGWAVEIDPSTKKIINQPGGREDKDKLWAMGNFKHENAVIRADLRTVYQGADAPYRNEETREGDGYLFKFVASNREDLSQGNLYVYKGDKISNHEWIKLKNGDPNEDGMTKEKAQSEQNSTIAQCEEVGATAFGGIEDVEINPMDSLIYFAVKRESIGDINQKGVIYRFKDTSTGIEEFDIYAGGNSSYDGVAWGEGNDNLLFDDLGNLWVAQDGNFNNGDNNYIWVLENGHSQAVPKVKIFARTPAGSEPTGLTFTPDYKYVFMSIQHPKNNNSGQTDIFDSPVTFNEDVVLVFARNKFLGNDLTSEDQDILITQYYHDPATDSKWIEIKNISGEDIPIGTYFIDLYDSEDLANITSTEPKASEAVPAIMKDEVILLKNSESPASPLASQIGNADQIISSVADFDGNDVILITTTPGTRKYTNRKDIIGNITATEWGQNNSLIRGGNSSELPERDFDANNWIEMDSLKEVSLASKLKNIALGTHVKGSAIWNGASWDNNSPPDRTRNTEINGNYDGGQDDFAAYDLNINDGGSLKFKDNAEGFNKNLFVHRNLTIHSNGALVIGDTESLIIKSEFASVNGQIEKIEKSTTSNPEDITYWSSPVIDAQIENVFKDVNTDRIFYFDQKQHLENNPDSETYYDVWMPATGTMTVAKGYAAEGVKDGDEIRQMSFTGRPNFGIIESEVLDFHMDAIDNDFNLIGNPYPSAIDIEVFLTENEDVIDGTAYFWNHTTGLVDGEYSNDDYVTYNRFTSVPEVGKNIGSGQGFFISSKQQEGKVVFNHNMILPGANNQFFKGIKEKGSIEKNILRINLKGSDNSFKQIVIGFDENGSDQMDFGYDSKYLKGNQPIALYSLLDKSKLSIQVLGTFNDQKVVKIGFDADLEGLDMKIELSRKEGLLRDQEILLWDNDDGILHDLNSSPYHFVYDGKGSFIDRFNLLFNSAVLGVDQNIVDEDINIYMKDQNLIIDASNLIEQIKIYDTLGRLVLNAFPQTYHSELELDRIQTGGFFIVELIDDHRKTLIKKMIKY